jgi:hydrogenase nickel incorporation protein HypA/HybF
MHELSIAQSIAALALRHADGRRVEKVELRVGHLRQVVPDALAFAWELVTPETPLAGSELQITEVPAKTACRACSAESEQRGFPLACGECGSLDVAVIAGEELLVDALQLQEEPLISGGMR